MPVQAPPPGAARNSLPFKKGNKTLCAFCFELLLLLCAGSESHRLGPWHRASLWDAPPLLLWPQGFPKSPWYHQSGCLCAKSHLFWGKPDHSPMWSPHFPSPCCVHPHGEMPTLQQGDPNWNPTIIQSGDVLRSCSLCSVAPWEQEKQFLKRSSQMEN